MTSELKEESEISNLGARAKETEVIYISPQDLGCGATRDRGRTERSIYIVGTCAMSMDRVFATVFGILMIPLGIWIMRKASAKDRAVYYQLGKFGGLFVGAGLVLLLIGLGVVRKH